MPSADDVASVVLSKSTWAVLGLTCHIELFAQVHYKQSIAPDTTLSPLYKDIFLYHWKDESQHAILDELEWVHADQQLSVQERDRRHLEQLANDPRGLARPRQRARADMHRRSALELGAQDLGITLRLLQAAHGQR